MSPDQALSIVTTGSGLTQYIASNLHQRHTALDGVDGLCVAGLAGAPLHIVDHDTLGVLAAGVGLARLDGSDAGDGRGVALVPGQTEAHGPVSNHPTPRVGAALVAPTLGAIGDAPHEGVAGLAPGTRADGVTIVQLADGALTTGGGDAGVGGHGDGGAAHVGVALVAGLAGADRVVVGELAHSVGAAEAGAHRETFPLESVTVFVLGTVRVLCTMCAALVVIRIASHISLEPGFDFTLATIAEISRAPGAALTIISALTSGNVDTLSPVVGDLAVLGAGALAQAAGVDTLLVLTRLSGGALAVVSATHRGSLNTSIIGINLKSRRTKLADSLVIFHNTGSVAGADLAFTGVSALEVDTGLVARASSVLQTNGDAWCAA